MDLCPHGTGLTPRMEVRAMEEGRVWPKAPYGTHTRRVSAPARPITAPLAVWLLCWYQGGSHNRWQRGYFHQTGGVHRWYHFCGRLLPQGTLQRAVARSQRWNWVSTALCSPSGDDGTRQEGGSSVGRSGWCGGTSTRSGFARRWPRAGPSGVQDTRLGACDWRSSPMRSAVSVFDSAAFHLGQLDLIPCSTGHRCLGGTRGRGPDA